MLINLTFHKHLQSYIAYVDFRSHSPGTFHASGTAQSHSRTRSWHSHRDVSYVSVAQVSACSTGGLRMESCCQQSWCSRPSHERRALSFVGYSSSPWTASLGHWQTRQQPVTNVIQWSSRRYRRRQMLRSLSRCVLWSVQSAALAHSWLHRHSQLSRSRHRCPFRGNSSRLIAPSYLGWEGQAQWSLDVELHWTRLLQTCWETNSIYLLFLPLMIDSSRFYLTLGLNI